MKKICLLLIPLVLVLTGCKQQATPKIDQYTWTMSSVQSVEADGQAIAYGKQGSSTLETAKEVVMVCQGKDGKLTLTDQTNEKTYAGTYFLAEVSPQSHIYKIAIDGQDGIAVTAMTTYSDNTQTPTLILRLEAYVINFYADTEPAI